MNIAMLCESDLRGGAEAMMLTLSVRLRERGHSVCFIGPGNGCGWLGDAFRSAGFQTHVADIHRRFDLACALRLRRLALDHDLDLFHTHQFAMGFYGALAARLAGIGDVLTMHGVGDIADKLRRRVALRWAFTATGRLVVVSDALRYELDDAIGSKAALHAEVIRNGIRARLGQGDNVRAELGVDGGTSLIVNVGNCYQYKGQIVLLEALSLLPTDQPWKAAIVGRYEDQVPLLRAFIAQHGWEDRVRLLGERADVPDILAAADIFAMSSHAEGLPLALLEAMGSALPIASTAVGGIPEAVRDGIEGLLVPPADPPALADALSTLLTDRALGETLGKAAQRRMRSEFSLEGMTQSYEALYEAVLSEKGIQPARPANAIH